MTPQRLPIRTAVLISGRGSNMLALHAQCAESMQLVGVVSNKPDAAGIPAAAALGLPAICVDHRDFASRPEFEQAVLTQLRAWRTELVVLAGFMRILSDTFLHAYPGRIVNIHPSLLPKHPGLHPHRAALEARDAVTGCTVHLVEPGAVDGGRILAQREVPIVIGDTENTLADRVLAAEHALYAEAVGHFAATLRADDPTESALARNRGERGGDGF